MNALTTRLHPVGHWKTLYGPEPISQNRLRRVFDLYHEIIKELSLDSKLKLVIDVYLTPESTYTSCMISCHVEEADTKVVVSSTISSWYSDTMMSPDWNKFKKECIHTLKGSI